ncbi:MAG: RNA polymerase sigma factor [Myxococcaceae bacterium]
MEGPDISALYERYGYLVHRRCLSILGSRADADDALQEVFMRVQRYQAPDDPNASLRWLYAIAGRCCFDLHRVRSKAEPMEPGALDTRTVGDAADADRRAFVGAALRSVGPRTREIALLAHVDGYTQEEVAAQTGYSRKTIGKKLKSFEERMRRFLGGGAT